MNATQLLQRLSGELGGLGLSDSGILNEISLLLIWLKLERENYPIPGLDDVVRGEITLGEMYRKISEAVSGGSEQIVLGRFFENSSAPDRISLKMGQQIGQLLIEASRLDVFDIVDALYDIASRWPVPDREIVLSEDLAKLMFQVGESSAPELYASIGGSSRIAIQQTKKGRRAWLEVNNPTPLLLAISLLTEVELIWGNPSEILDQVQREKLRQYPVVQLVTALSRHGSPARQGASKKPSRRSNNPEVHAIEHGISRCEGRMVVLVTQGLLFRPGDYYDLRVNLIDRGLVDAVIRMPEQISPNGSMVTYILVLDKRRDVNDPVLFYDATHNALRESGVRQRRGQLTNWKRIAEEVVDKKVGPYSVLVKKDAFKAHNYDLSINRYVLGTASSALQALIAKSSDSALGKLSDVAKLIRAQPLKEADPPIGDIYYSVGMSDIDEKGKIRAPSKRLILSGRARDRANLQRLQAGDILLSIKGSLGRVGLVGEDCGENWVANQVFQIIRLKDSTNIESPVFLYRYLASPLMKGVLQEQGTGTAIPMLKTADIKELVVLVPSIAAQGKVLETHAHIMDCFSQIEELRNRIQVLSGKHWTG